ncbi:hypothetical protein KC730_02690 [Candidatus Kaiserbacteria bacterium]|nr:hypothetical protein [Candidatus Kaiserbacteria bacterium]
MVHLYKLHEYRGVIMIDLVNDDWSGETLSCHKGFKIKERQKPKDSNNLQETKDDSKPQTEMVVYSRSLLD